MPAPSSAPAPSSPGRSARRTASGSHAGRRSPGPASSGRPLRRSLQGQQHRDDRHDEHGQHEGPDDRVGTGEEGDADPQQRARCIPGGPGEQCGSERSVERVASEADGAGLGSLTRCTGRGPRADRHAEGEAQQRHDRDVGGRRAPGAPRPRAARGWRRRPASWSTRPCSRRRRPTPAGPAARTPWPTRLRPAPRPPGLRRCTTEPGPSPVDEVPALSSSITVIAAPSSPTPLPEQACNAEADREKCPNAPQPNLARARLLRCDGHGGTDGRESADAGGDDGRAVR